MQESIVLIKKCVEFGRTFCRLQSTNEREFQRQIMASGFTFRSVRGMMKVSRMTIDFANFDSVCAALRASRLDGAAKLTKDLQALKKAGRRVV